MARPQLEARSGDGRPSGPKPVNGIGLPTAISVAEDTSSRRRRRRGVRTRRRCARVCLAPAITATPTARASTGARKRELGAGREARREAGDGDRRVGGAFLSDSERFAPFAGGGPLIARIRPRPRRRRGVDQDRDRGEDERDADDVVERLAGLELDQLLGAERDRAADQALRAEAVGASDAVGGEQAEGEEAEVEQRREDVAAEGEQPDRVQDLRVRRVVGGEEDRVEVVDRARGRRSARTGSRAACGTRACRRGPCPRRGAWRVGTIQAAATTAPRRAASQIAIREPAAPAGSRRGLGARLGVEARAGERG